MAIPRPKILTAITIPTGGYTLKIYISAAADAMATAVSVTIAAGTYFISGDWQSDDLLREVATKLQAGVTAIGAPFNANAKVLVDITSVHKIRFTFDGSTFQGATSGVKMAWTESTSMAPLLGFDASADDTNTGDNPQFTADWQHSHGWYADEDGLLESVNTEDDADTTSFQAVSLSGVVHTQQAAVRYKNKAMLRFLPKAKTYSKGIAYGTANVYPYERNQGLECWWKEATKGTRFRFYRDGYFDTGRVYSGGTASASNTTTLTDSAKAWDIDPYEFVGGILYLADLSASLTVPQTFYISSHTATVITIPAAHSSGYSLATYSTTYYLYRHTYQTYVLDVGDMKTFSPREIPALDRYDIDIPMLRYV